MNAWQRNVGNTSALRLPAARGPAALLVILAVGAAPVRSGEKLEFNKDIRPILAEACFACHGPDKNTRKADLRLDQRAVAVDSGAIVPGHPEKSEMIDRIFSTEASEKMPPPRSGKKLTAAQKETLKRWIAAGAEYQPHWSFIPPKRPEPPAVKGASWVRNPIDSFILAELEKRGLNPAPEADRRTLARRLSLDLIGLPPTPAEVEAFVKDPSTEAYEHYIDKLLKSAHWGEHRGRFWLDAARYADTHGIHFDNYREMWTFRDWVIKAFNRNMPFDQFTVEQLAGDLLPNRTLDQQVASGFNRCNITSNEGGLIPEEYLVLYDRDRTETSARVWLGLTAGCAVCHDHKFDPLSQREFYQLAAFFNNTTQGAMDGNIKDTPPIVFVPRLEDRARWEVVVKELAEARKQADARKLTARADFEKWLASARAEQVTALIPENGLSLHARLSEGDGNSAGMTVEGKPREVTAVSGLAWDTGHVAARAYKSQPVPVLEIADAGDFEKDKGFSYGAWVKLTRNVPFGAVVARMDDQHDFRGWDLWIQNGQVGTHIIHKWPDDALKVVSRKRLPVGQWSHLFVTYDGSAQVAGVKVYINGVEQPTNVEARSLRSTIRTQVPLKIAQRHSTARLNDTLIQDLRLYGRALSAAEVDRLARATRAAWLAAKPADKRTPSERDELFGWWLAAVDKPAQALQEKVRSLQQEEATLKTRGTIAHVMQERPQLPEAFVLFRGDYDKRREAVKPGTPRFLPPLPSDLPKNRLGLARWLIRPENPLMARVTVNRFWQEVFGTGIVRTSGDFGTTGELPSHPELLDWLAVEFRDSGWDVKKLFKLMVMSATYRQVAVTTAEKREKDPQNRLLSRGARFRMDAEAIRDYALAASGLLVTKIGGPSVRPYQPEGVWEAVAMIGSNTRDYRRDTGHNLYRRSLYTFWKRAAPPASMDIFNAPSRETCTVQRERTDTPLQALVTLNDPQFVEAARHLAQLALKEGVRGQGSGAKDTTKNSIDLMARRLLARPLSAEETKVVKASLADLLAFYKGHPDNAKKLIAVGESKADAALEPATLAAWTMLANELLNLDEVLNK
jgi:hypothetical protein